MIIQGGLIGRLVKWVGEKRLVTFVTGLLAATLFLMPITHHVALFLFVLVGMAAGIGIHNPSVNSLVSKNTDADAQGGMLGLNQSFSSLARVLAPVWAGFFYDRLGSQMTLWSASGLMIVAMLLSLKLYGKDLAQSGNSSA